MCKYVYLWQTKSIVIIFNLIPTVFKAYFATWVSHSTFTTRRLHASPRENAQRQKVEMWASNVLKFQLNAYLHVTYLRSFTCHKATTKGRRLYFTQRRKASWGFSRPNHPNFSSMCESAYFGTKHQQATSGPPKSLNVRQLQYKDCQQSQQCL